MRKYFLLLFLLVVYFTTSTYCYGQKWTELNPPLNPFNSTIEATALGPAGTIYAVGDFTNSSQAYFVAQWKDSSWSELGQGALSLHANGQILTLASRGNNVYAAGFFTNAAGKNYVARWDGTHWDELGTGANALNANSFIYSLTTDKTGNVYAAGRFTDSAGNHYVAKWDGTTWSQVGSKTSSLNANNDILTITTDSSDNLYAGGDFTNVAGKYYVAKWNGIAWSETGSGSASLNANSFISCLATDAIGNLYAGGDFRNDSNDYYLAKWNGTAWSDIGYLAGYLSIATIAVKSPTEIYAAGYSPYTYTSVAKWDGSAWSELQSNQSPLVANNAILSLQVDSGGNLIAGGKFTNKSGHQFITRWDGTGWNEVGSKGDPFYTSQPIYQVISDSVGNVYVSGNFADNSGRSYLEHWNGSGWQLLQLPDTSTLFLFINGAHNMKLDKKGNLYVTGRHITSTNNGYDCVLKWDGTQWSIVEDFPNSLETFNNNPVYGINEIEMDPQGNIYVAGSFTDSVYGLCSLAKWDGKTWSRLPGSLADYIQQFCVSGDGNIYANGGFGNSSSGYHIYNYNPAKHFNWEEVKNGTNELSAPGLNIFTALAVDSSNNLYVNGDFTDSAGKRYVAKWDKKIWSELGVTGSLGWTLAIDPKNTIYVSNGIGSASVDAVQKWNGSSWVAVGAPLDANGVYPSGKVLATDAAGNVYTDALSIGSSGSYIAKYATPSLAPPKLLSFSPTSGSAGTTVTIAGTALTGTLSVSFGGTEAASFTEQNDSTLTATVGSGATGSVKVTTTAGADSIRLFTYSCDSVSQPIPVISSTGDSILTSSTANYYQWFYNNNKLNNEVYRNLDVEKTGFYRVETSVNNLCWTASLDYPVLVNRNPLPDSLKMSTYPNPSEGNFTVDVKLPQTTTVLAYVAVYDLTGVQVLQTNKLIFFGNEIRIPVTITSKGTFVVKVFVNGDSRQQTILIM